MKIQIATANQVTFNLTLWRYQAFGEDAANYFDGTIFRKAVKVHDETYLLCLSQDENRIMLEIQPTPANSPARSVLEGIAKDILGLRFPLEEFYQFARNDRVLSDLTHRFRGLRPTLTPNLFEAMVTSITAQQINLRFAFAVRSRLVRQFGETFSMNGRLFYTFPSPGRLALASIESLQKLQLTMRKSEYIIGLSGLVSSGELDLECLPKMSDEEIMDRLLPIRGIGRWSVDWLLARGLGRGNACPVGDLGVRKAIQHFYFDGEKKTEEELREFAAQWRDYANLAVHYLLKGWAERK
jgi:DNA-3-methyladenine glycosylase II